MIFAHGPLGWLSAGWLQRIWKIPGVTPRQGWWWLVIGAVGGVFPDVDLLYFHLVSAEVSHRQLPTHAVLFYVPLVVLVASLARWRKAWFIYGAAWCFGLGVLGHLITDSVGGAIMWLWPFVTEPYGLFSIPAIAQSVHATRLFLYNFLMEGVWISLFIWLWGPKVVRFVQVTLWKVLVGIFLLTWSGFFIFLFQHTTHLPAGIFYGDADKDKQINMTDADLDGDGVVNAEDTDADGDGVENRLDVAQAADSFVGVWADPTQNELAQVLTRMGLLTNGHVANRAFASAGFFWREQMTMDYQANARGYVSQPSAADFETTAANRKAYFTHHQMLFTGFALDFKQIKPGDIVYFAHGEPEGVVVKVEVGAIQVVRTQTGQGTELTTISQQAFPFTILAAGRVWL